MPTNFQGSINQTLGFGAAAAALSGKVAEKQEETKLKKTIDVAKGEAKQLTETIQDFKTPDEERDAATKTVDYLQGQVESSRKKLFEMNPKQKYLQDIQEGYVKQGRNEQVIQKGYDNASKEAEEQGYQDMIRQAYQDGIEQYDDERANAAMERAQKQAKARAKRRNFVRDYLSQMQTSLGGPVGELPIDVQKVIASSYSSKERRKIMNQKDREKNQGGNK